MSNRTYISAPRNCDVCKFDDGVETEAKYDARLTAGPWANVCEEHFATRTSGKLGTGYGQQLIVGEEPERTREDIRRDVDAAIEAGDFNALEEAVGDGDMAEWL